MEWLKKESKTFLPAIQAADEIHTINSVDSVTMSVPTKENALALAAVDTGGKNMQE